MVAAATSGGLPFASRRSMTVSIAVNASAYSARSSGVAADAYRADHHDAASGAPQGRQHGLGDGELVGHVHLKLSAERLQRHQFGRAGQAVAGVVHQAIQAARAGVPVDDGRRGGDVAGVGDVEHDRGHRTARRRLDQPLAILRLADTGVDVLTCRGQPQHGGAADPGRAAGDEGVLAGATHDSSRFRFLSQAASGCPAG
jgi:hypothetical protein